MLIKSSQSMFEANRRFHSVSLLGYTKDVFSVLTVIDLTTTSLVTRTVFVSCCLIKFLFFTKFEFFLNLLIKLMFVHFELLLVAYSFKVKSWLYFKFNLQDVFDSIQYQGKNKRVCCFFIYTLWLTSVVLFFQTFLLL